MNFQMLHIFTYYQKSRNQTLLQHILKIYENFLGTLYNLNL